MKNQNTKSKAFLKIKTLDDACKVVGITNKVEIRRIKASRPKELRAYKKLRIIMNAINKGSKLDSQYIPYFKYEPKFQFNSVGSNVGGTIFFATEEMARYSAKNFRDIFNEMLNK